MENGLRQDTDLCLSLCQKAENEKVSTQDLVDKHQLQMMLPVSRRPMRLSIETGKVTNLNSRKELKARMVIWHLHSHLNPAPRLRMALRRNVGNLSLRKRAGTGSRNICIHTTRLLREQPRVTIVSDANAAGMAKRRPW